MTSRPSHRHPGRGRVPFTTDVELEDLETGRTMLTSGTAARSAYRRDFADFPSAGGHAARGTDRLHPRADDCRRRCAARLPAQARGKRQRARRCVAMIAGSTAGFLGLIALAGPIIVHLLHATAPRACRFRACGSSAHRAPQRSDCGCRGSSAARPPAAHLAGGRGGSGAAGRGDDPGARVVECPTARAVVVDVSEGDARRRGACGCG